MNKYVITGSVGHISRPIIEGLIKNGNEVTVITSKTENKGIIEQLGATAAIGTVEDVNFLTKTFTGTDAVYLMIPPNFAVNDWYEHQKSVANNYRDAIVNAKVKHVVILSSIGAHMKKGAGPVDGLAYLEDRINELANVNSLALRPSYFYYNLFNMIPLIKNAGIVGSTQPGKYELVLTHTNDIAKVALDKLSSLDFKEHSVEYIASDTKSWNEITQVLTKAINKEGVPYVEFTDEQSLQGMLGAGLPTTIANGYVTMGQALRSGEMQADYKNNTPSKFGSNKLEDFVKEFVVAYNS